MKKKHIGAIITAAVLLLIAAVFFALVNSIYGNPVSKLLAKSTAKARISQEYSAAELRIGKAIYSLKDDLYHVKISSDVSPDTYFCIETDGWGRFVQDDYAETVAGGRNTAERLSRDYDALLEAALASAEFPYHSDIAIGELRFASAGEIPADAAAPAHLEYSALELDKAYDLAALGAQYGNLIVYVDDGTVSVEKAAEVLMALKTAAEAGGVAFDTLSFTLQHPKPEDGTPRPEDTILMLDFPSEDIYPDGMAERVRQADAAARAYYHLQDEAKYGS